MKTYYVCIRKKDNKLVICSGKSSVTAFSGISSDTIRRNATKDIYENKEYILYMDIELINKNSPICCNNYMQMQQNKKNKALSRNIDKTSDLRHLHRADTAKHTIIVDSIEYDISQPIPGLF